jgi:hypothetical protein
LHNFLAFSPDKMQIDVSELFKSGSLNSEKQILSNSIFSLRDSSSSKESTDKRTIVLELAYHDS